MNHSDSVEAKAPIAAASTQKIFRVRRDYNSWVANESMEDYALRYTPRSFRKWSEWRVGNTALGAVSFLALEAIGGSIVLSYGFTNAVLAIIATSLIIFIVTIPISYYAARYAIDMELLTRGAGFGYLGSTITSLIYASFSFIFFALESAIMAVALQMYLDIPIIWCYVICSLIIIPMVIGGVTLMSKIQIWTQPIWAFLLLLPYLAVAWKNPQAYIQFSGMAGFTSGGNEFDPLMFGAASAVAFSLVVQIGEQVDFLRFLPEKNKSNRTKWWAAVILAGPGWIVPGMLKMLGGAFLAFLVLQSQLPANKAAEPTQMYLAGFAYVFDDAAWVLAATVVFVLISQIKINLTNAYAGSLAWSNFFARLTHSHPGRVVWLFFNVTIALVLMSIGVFQTLEIVLSLYGNLAIAWIGSLVADLVINKPLRLSPAGIEFKRAHLYDVNPVGLGSMLIATAIAMFAYSGYLGPYARAFSPLIALCSSLILSPIICLLTKGKYYLARTPATWDSNTPTKVCDVCENTFETSDMAYCPAYAAPICSLCCTLESRCHDNCKENSNAIEQFNNFLQFLFPKRRSQRFNFRLGHFLIVVTSLSAILATVLYIVFIGEVANLSASASDLLATSFFKIFAILVLIAATCSWLVVLSSESKKMAQEESNRQNHLLEREIEAHSITDAALQAALEVAESANQAKTRYVAGMSHELRTPLNSILGYSQILLKNEKLPPRTVEIVSIIQQSGEHLVGLIDGLLDLARIEAGRMQLELVPLDLHNFINEIARMVEPQSEAKGLIFSWTKKADVPRWVITDGKRLRQILLNLLANAVRFTDSGGTIKLEAAMVDGDINFDITDTGVGILPQDQQRIFLPFERGSAGRQSGEPGTGLGLAISLQLSVLMEGELTLVESSNQGSLFRLRLHLKAVSDPGREINTPRQISGYTGKRLKLLIVDDHAVHRQMLAGMLSPLGFILREAASGTESLDILEDYQPDAILLDITMDDMNGWEVATKIRALGWISTPIIMVSANAFENDPELLEQFRCQAFLVKPVSDSQLLLALEKFLGIEWKESEKPLIDVNPAALHSLMKLPDHVVADLLKMLRIGHVRGLLSLLDDISSSNPDYSSSCAQFRQLVMRFDLEKMEIALQQQMEG
jgi:signal transduction histidine kinase/CheY-like chemotaxis protein/purine-cytosine permease-like protein